jgi:DNA-binding NarL/FixJ family response regulator
MLELALAWLEAPAHPAERVFALNYLAAVSAYLGEYQATESYCAESLALAAPLGDLHGRVVALSILCLSNADRGDLAAARQWGEQSLALEHQLGSPGSLAFSLANLGKVLAAGGDHAGAATLFRQSLAARQSIGDLRGVATCLDMLGSVTIAQGRAGEGVNSYLESLALFREIGDIWGAASVLRALAAFAAQRAELPAAAALLDEATRLALETGARTQLHAIFKTRKAQPAEISAELAGAPGAHYDDPEATPALAARILSGRSIHAAAGLKLDTALERVRALAQPEQAQPAPSPRPHSARPGGLTAREWEVLHLVAEGLTDAQIAERLVLSRRTVTSYLTSVYSKLGVSSRSAATRWMLEQRFQ